jgi:hypothetical protein
MENVCPTPSTFGGTPCTSLFYLQQQFALPRVRRSSRDTPSVSVSVLQSATRITTPTNSANVPCLQGLHEGHHRHLQYVVQVEGRELISLEPCRSNQTVARVGRCARC